MKYGRRILFLSPQPFFQWRGSPIRVAFDVEALVELGFEVDLLTLPFGEDRRIRGVRVIRVPNVLGRRDLPIGPSCVKAVYGLLLAMYAAAFALRRRYTALHGIEEAAALALPAALLGRTKLVYEKHSDPSSYRGGRIRNLVMDVYARVERFTARRADAVIGTGPGLVEQVRATGTRAPVYHIFDIPSSRVDASDAQIAAVRERLVRKPDDVLATYVGSFAAYQGVDLMFEAIPLTVAAHPNVRFVVIGGAPEEIAARRVWLRERNVPETSVVFPGKCAPDELPAWLAASDILLSPRLAGVNTPLKLLDYLKAGRAIVATDTPANRLLLDESRAVLTAPDPPALAGGISRLVADADLCARLGRAGRERILTRYNLAEFTRRLGFCYERMLGAESGNGAGGIGEQACR